MAERWRAQQDGRVLREDDAGRMVLLAEVFGSPIEERDKWAALIAAAPDLLASLLCKDGRPHAFWNYKAEIDNSDGHNCFRCGEAGEDIDKFQTAALAKARGESVAP